VQELATKEVEQRIIQQLQIMKEQEEYNEVIMQQQMQMVTKVEDDVLRQRIDELYCQQERIHKENMDFQERILKEFVRQIRKLREEMKDQMMELKEELKGIGWKS
jgi:hypothetical protein